MPVLRGRSQVTHNFCPHWLQIGGFHQTSPWIPWYARIAHSTQRNGYLCFSSVQLLSQVWLFATPWTAEHPTSLFITNSQSLHKLMSFTSLLFNKRYDNTDEHPDEERRRTRSQAQKLLAPGCWIMYSS